MIQSFTPLSPLPPAFGRVEKSLCFFPICGIGRVVFHAIANPLTGRSSFDFIQGCSSLFAHAESPVEKTSCLVFRLQPPFHSGLIWPLCRALPISGAFFFHEVMLYLALQPLFMIFTEAPLARSGTDRASSQCSLFFKGSVVVVSPVRQRVGRFHRSC